MRARTTAVAGAAALLVGLLPGAAVSSAALKPKPKASAKSTLVVQVKAPKGVPASALVKGRGKVVVSKAPAGRKTVERVKLKAGRYKVQAPDLVHGGKVYAAKVSATRVRLVARKKTKVRVVYRAVKVAHGLHADKLEPGSVSLRWRQVKGKVVLRRTSSDRPSRKATKGTKVKIRNGRTVDTKVKPGKTYSYALFTKKKGRWRSPVTLTLVAPSATPGEARWSAPPSTTIIGAGDKDAVRIVGDQVQVRLRPGRQAPLLGSGFVLPASTVLPGGYLGTVSDLSADGRTVTLAPGGLADAFDYHQVSVKITDAAPIPLEPVTGAAGVAALEAHHAQEVEAAAATGGRPASAQEGSLKPCLGGSENVGVSLSPTIVPGGHFESGFLRKWGVVTGAYVDLSTTLALDTLVDLKVAAAVSCGIPFKPVMYPLTKTPVPISIHMAPVAEFSLGGAVEVTDARVVVTGGFWAKAGLGIGGHFDSGLIKSIQKTEPVSVSKVAAVKATIGGQLIVGPGTGNHKVGAIAGVGGSFYPLDVAMSGVFTSTSDSRRDSCLKVSGAMSGGLSLEAKAWLGNWSKSKTFTLDALNGRIPYDPDWYWKTNCENLPPSDPDDSLGGDGVDLDNGNLDGDPDQAGYVDGFVPGEKTWVISTGRIGEAVGSPDFHASTDLGRPGSPRMSELAGAETFDAVSYSVDVVPKGGTLHVKFLFASEEYPEYVNEGYNDVMALFVDGKNCGFVPGTQTPVAVDTVNAGSHAQYYVDNSTGAPGYGTTYDGLTVPMECTMPVTPGKKIAVTFAIADTGDEIYDSAIGLVDKGIWSD